MATVEFINFLLVKAIKSIISGKRRLPCHIRSDNGPEFTAKVVRRWLEKFEMKNLFIEPSSSWENDYNESFNGKLTDEWLNGEIFNNLKETEILIEQWRKEFNGLIPHSALCYQYPAPLAVLPKVQIRHHLRLTLKVEHILGAGQWIGCWLKDRGNLHSSASL